MNRKHILSGRLGWTWNENIIESAWSDEHVLSISADGLTLTFSARSKKRRKIKNILTGPRLAFKNDTANWNFFFLAFYHFIARLVDEQVFSASEDEKCENMISASLIAFLLALQRSSEVVNIKRSNLIENIFAKSSRISESNVDMHWPFEADQRGLVTQFVISFCSAPWRRSARIVYLRKSPM